MRQLLQVEGQGVAGDAHRVGEGTGRHSVRPGGDQGPHHPQAMLLTEGREGREGLSFVHRSANTSIFVEM
ncbi:hypothetical protein mvi_17990 [Methylobacterium indicum]|uniref:Uncharacterized protein n=1 Tax=Methylobacterium indicum TaxID=1775910 RepID=A0A8H8WS76_9HYPH|nr:hypothetical protein mvi_17990 [Methylobacterium indicum]